MSNKVVIGIVNKENQVLIVKRKQKEGDLFWQFPGGGVEDGETNEQAIIRELREETGIDSIPIKCLGERIHPSTKKEMSYWSCEYISGDLSISDDDLDEAIWVPVSKCISYFTTPVFQPILDYLGLS